ncbi:DNA-binding LacI/PurR family transcriptional regulator [Paenibacillus sp. PastF-1]|uniref:LacI family DNA-binding transcriptional regulator n=2 Tax=unclassified Paenibacillus TaxID=185978 RepID=UPI002406C167|nr:MULTISPECIES: LacI family DNA-binding transcriptional regulator [unclassified Paenibacillus]MDF9855755.1 DNA-binding LacI/PurR family transcriptional regulator [Paenibacillus sp. PastF-1]MDH6481041.1 DNA-binding LacI/PurR family transcriptional regulator [Paenibacillus sp. PastH-2]
MTERKNMAEKEITIKDVARLAGVSVATVSRVMNGRDRVSDATRKKIQRIIEELNFVPNTMAASMVNKKTHMLAVVVPEIQNPFYTAVIGGTVEAAKKEGFSTLVVSTYNDEAEEEEFFEGFLGRNVDGIILIGTHKEAGFYRNIRKPTILVDRYINDCGHDGVLIDNFRGAYEAAKHFVEYGHERIAIIDGAHDFNDGKDRYWGYHQALHEHGIVPEPGYHKQGKWLEEDGYRFTMELMQSAEPPTAIFATNNVICTGAIKAIRDLNLRIGEDISLIGFDENELAQFVQPRVTVVGRPMREMGIQATEMLIQKIKTPPGEQTKLKRIVLDVELIKRGSVKKLN